MLELANFLQSIQLQDVSLDCLIEALKELKASLDIRRLWLAGSHIRRIYEVTSAGAELRKFLVDLSLYGWVPLAKHDLQIELCPVEFCHSFMKDSLPYMLKHKGVEDVSDPTNVSHSCKYHEHTKRGKPCYKDTFRYLPKTASPAHGELIPPFAHFRMLTIYRRRGPSNRDPEITINASKYPERQSEST